ncbi:glycerophosphodiester phosphodiesterase [Parabacteroides bouchesdurhonensis]|uniref:glycerophosphodiester phosphodiesterase n=1 Tax=Parabacteroides bouchesdurhonensis TaxID=1936995 RepID=UPI000C84D0FA|nr:glycerophosphodiester phosphodiesterase family protein [Parabacteroides bouchesdurhonensis]
MKNFCLIALSCILNFGYVQASHPIDANEAPKENVHIQPQFYLIAHRGGVVDRGKNLENSIAALDEAIERGYVGAEIDVRQSKDGKLFLYHNRSFERDYDSKGRGADMTWEEIQALRPLKEGIKAPVSMEEYCNHAKGKLKELMIDIKLDKPSLEFYQELERILKDTGFLNSSYFIGHGEYFRGKGPLITMLMRETNDFFKEYGEKTKDYYFLFAGVDEINGRTIKWAQDNGIKIMCCANLPFRGNVEPDNLPNAGRNIKWLIEWGVVNYQIDSDYDIFFR